MNQVKTKTFVCATILGMGCAISAYAGSGDAVSAPSTIGYLDPHTGVFRPLMNTTERPESAAASTKITGEIKITGTVAIVSPSITSTTPITCSATGIVVGDANGPVLEEASSSATITGTTASCTVLIPYEWLLVTPTADTVTISVGVSALSAAPRIHTQQLATLTVPANGVTTSFSFVTRL
jgi:hypothetical protein